MISFFTRFELKKHGLLLCGLFLSIYFTYHLLAGPRSIYHLDDMKAKNAVTANSLLETSHYKDALEQQVLMLRADTLDVDFLEERARIMLGYIGQDEVIVKE